MFYLLYYGAGLEVPVKRMLFLDMIYLHNRFFFLFPFFCGGRYG